MNRVHCSAVSWGRPHGHDVIQKAVSGSHSSCFLLPWQHGCVFRTTKRPIAGFGLYYVFNGGVPSFGVLKVRLFLLPPNISYWLIYNFSRQTKDSSFWRRQEIRLTITGHISSSVMFPWWYTPCRTWAQLFLTGGLKKTWWLQVCNVVYKFII